MSATKQCLAVTLVLAASVVAQTPARAQCEFKYANTNSTGAQARFNSLGGRFSADGRYVSFGGLSPNLVPGDTNATWDAFRKDLRTGLTEIASVGPGGVVGNGMVFHAVVISDDGTRVAFESGATNLIAASDTNGANDVFVHDFTTGVTSRVSMHSLGQFGTQESSWPEISGNGRFVAFQSKAANLVSGDTNNRVDIFVRDLALGTTERVSVSTGGLQADSDCIQPWISQDGRFVLFKSSSLVFDPSKTSFYQDGFIRDRLLGTTERFTLDFNGGDPIGGDCTQPRCSADGRWIVWQSSATDLVPGAPVDNVDDIFLLDRETGVNQQISLAPGGAFANSASQGPSISADGRRIVFTSFASNLVAGDAISSNNAFVFERGSATMTMIDRLAGGNPSAGTQTVALANDIGLYVMQASGSSFGLPDVNGNFTSDIITKDCQ